MSGEIQNEFQKSGLLLGVGEDAAIIASQITSHKARI
jgi:hypothetical protein